MCSPDQVHQNENKNTLHTVTYGYIFLLVTVTYGYIFLLLILGYTYNLFSFYKKGTKAMYHPL